MGFPKAVQVMVILPPSLASMYWGGVSVKVGGAAKETTKVRNGTSPPIQNSHCNSAECKDGAIKVEIGKVLPRGSIGKGKFGIQSQPGWVQIL